MLESLSVAEAKSRFSELLGRVSIGKERFVIKKHGKPVGAIISLEDLAQLEAPSEPEPNWLQTALETRGEFDDFAAIMDEVVHSRQFSKNREVSLD